MFLKRILRSILVLVLMFGSAQSAWAHGAPPQDVARSALGWLKTQQLPDGGFSNGFSTTGDVTATAQAVLAGVSVGEDVSGWRPASGRASPLDFLAAQVGTGALSGTGERAWTALALASAGLDARQVGGHDLLAELQSAYSSAQRLYGSGPGESALVLLALQALNQSPAEDADEGLIAARLPDSSWSYSGQAPGDPVTTALGIMALVSAGRAEAIQPSLEFLRQSQHPDKGWSYEPTDGRSKAGATGMVLQALAAAGEDLDDWGDPIDMLLDLQTVDNSFLIDAYTPGEHVPTAAQAIPALMGRSIADLPPVAAGRPSAGVSEWLRETGPAGNWRLWAGLGMAVVAGLVLGGWWLVRQKRPKEAN